jgi:hypothetical protein|tara:strand:+ start:234 stop:563 length:330 start_codon:yes stop_codon:yes gene_type:complete
VQGSSQTLTDIEVQALIAEALPNDIGITSVTGLSPGASTDAETHDVHFSVSCQCGASFLLGVEVSIDKTAEDMAAVMPTVVRELVNPAVSFQAKTCEEHMMMRMGPTAD